MGNGEKGGKSDVKGDLNMKRLCIITTMWSSINNWIIPFLNEYHARKIDITIVCNMDTDYERELKSHYPFIHTYPVAFPRGISVIGSLKSIMILYKLFKRNHFDMIQYSTPNASMYAAVASKLAGIPVRLYCQWGMVYVTMTGIKKEVFYLIERLVCHCSTMIQPDSEGNLKFCREQGLYDESKSCVIWNGSAKGLDLSAFNVIQKDAYAKEIKEKYGIAEDVPVIGFVGRLGKEKGCNELIRAFQRIKGILPDVKLLFVGPIEKENSMDPEILEYFWKCNDIIKTGRVSHVEKYISAMDVFVLPSYREGFGMSVVEASAMEVPVVVTEYPGPSSAMKDGVTGYAVPVKDNEKLFQHILKLLQDEQLRNKMGIAGRKFAEEAFDQKIFIQKYMDNRMHLLNM